MTKAVFDFINELTATKKDTITPSQTEVLKNAQKNAANEIRVAMPARIETYDYKKQMATVKPLFKRKFKDGKDIAMPLIYNVPVAHPRAGKAFVHMPLKKGDKVMLVFADKSMEKWLASGDDVEPNDARCHHLADAIAYPGLYPFNDGADVTNGDDIVIRNGNTIMHIKSNNHLQVINGTTELVKTMCDFMRAIREAWTATCGGPQRLHHPKFAELEKRFKSFLEV